jgi:hypothetical protein
MRRTLVTTSLILLASGFAAAAPSEADDRRCPPSDTRGSDVIPPCEKRMSPGAKLVLSTADCRTPRRFLALGPSYRDKELGFTTRYNDFEPKARRGRFRLKDTKLVVVGRVRERKFIVRNKSPFVVTFYYSLRCSEG